MVVLRGMAFFYERGTPVSSRPTLLLKIHLQASVLHVRAQFIHAWEHPTPYAPNPATLLHARAKFNHAREPATRLEI